MSCPDLNRENLQNCHNHQNVKLHAMDPKWNFCMQFHIIVIMVSIVTIMVIMVSIVTIMIIMVSIVNIMVIMISI